MTVDAARALDAVTAALPRAERRDGQRQMAGAVADAIVSGRHLVVQAGTGTGKTLAYLVPAILSHKRTVVASRATSTTSLPATAGRGQTLTSGVRSKRQGHFALCNLGPWLLECLHEKADRP